MNNRNGSRTATTVVLALSEANAPCEKPAADGWVRNANLSVRFHVRFVGADWRDDSGDRTVDAASRELALPIVWPAELRLPAITRRRRKRERRGLPC